MRLVPVKGGGEVGMLLVKGEVKVAPVEEEEKVPHPGVMGPLGHLAVAWAASEMVA